MRRLFTRKPRPQPQPADAETTAEKLRRDLAAERQENKDLRHLMDAKDRRALELEARLRELQTANLLAVRRIADVERACQGSCELADTLEMAKVTTAELPALRRAA